MDPTPGTTTASDSGAFDPQQAAALLNQTMQQARRRIEPDPPWLMVLRAVTFPVLYGADWLSVRGQHPYQGPATAILLLLVVVGVINIVASQTVNRRATAGVSGRSRLHPVEFAVMAVVWVGVSVIWAALVGAGVSRAIVYGIYPATVPLMAVGLAWAGIMAARANWRTFGTSLAIAIVGAVGAFAGPAGSFAVVAVGLFVVLLGAATVTAWGQRRSMVRP